VQPNDTLVSLAAIIGSSAEQLMAANCLTDPDNLEVGSIVYGPAYAAGDTNPQIESQQDSLPPSEASGAGGETVDDSSGDASSHDTEEDDEPEERDESESDEADEANHDDEEDESDKEHSDD
jgi:hypothetical protein